MPDTDINTRVTADTSDFAAGMRRAAGILRDFGGDADRHGSRASAMLRGVSTAAMGVATAMGTAAVAVGGFGLSQAMANESATVSFTKMLGSAEAAGAYMKELKDFAATTPFEFPELRSAASRFMGVGVEAQRVIPMLRAIGDATAAVGTGAEGIAGATNALVKMTNMGKITAESMESLSIAGVNGYAALAAHAGMSMEEVKKATQDGTLGVKDLMDAIQNYSGDAMQNVKGMMDEQSKTFEGLLSTLKDNVGQALGDMMLPAVAGIKNMLPAFTEAVNGALAQISGPMNDIVLQLIGLVGQLLPVISPVIGAVTQLAGGAFGALATVLQGLLPYIEPLVGLLTSIGSAIGSSLAPVLPGLGRTFGELAVSVGRVVEQFIQGVAPILPEIVKSFSDLMTALEPLMPVLAELAGEVGANLAAVFAELAPVLGDVAAIMLNDLAKAIELIGADNMAKLIIAWKGLNTVMALSNAIMAMSPWGQLALAIAAVAAVVAVLWDKFGPVVAVLGGIAAACALAFPVLSAFAAAGSTAAAAFLLAAAPFLAVAAAIAAVAAAAIILYQKWTPFRELVQTVAAAIRDGAVAAFRALVDAFQWVVETAPKVASAVGGALKSAFEALMGTLGKLWGIAQQVFGWIRDNVAPIFQAVWGVMASFFGWLQANVFPIFTALADLFVAVFQNIIAPQFEMFITGLQVIGGIVFVVFREIAETVMRNMQMAWDIFSAVIGFIVNLVQAAMPTIQATFGIAWAIIESVIRSTWLVIRSVIEVGIGAIRALWDPFWTATRITLETVWGVMKSVIESVLGVIRGIIMTITGLISGDWGKVWDGMKQILSSAWDGFFGVISSIGGGIIDWVSQMPGKIIGALVDLAKLLYNVGLDALHEMWRGLRDVFAALIDWFKTVPGLILGALGALGHLLWDIGKAILQGLWDGMKDKWEDLKGWIGGIGGWIKDLKGPIEDDRVLLEPEGRAVMEGLQNGMMDVWEGDLVPALGDMVEVLNSSVGDGLYDAGNDWLTQVDTTGLDINESWSAALGDMVGSTAEGMAGVNQVIGAGAQAAIAQAAAMAETLTAIFAAVGSSGITGIGSATSNAPGAGRLNATAEVIAALARGGLSVDAWGTDPQQILNRMFNNYATANSPDLAPGDSVLNAQSRYASNAQYIAAFRELASSFNAVQFNDLPAMINTNLGPIDKLPTEILDAIFGGMAANDPQKLSQIQNWANIWPVLSKYAQRAAGGPVVSGQPYLVGERGPEWFIPSGSGRIAPNGEGPGGGMVINIGTVVAPTRAAAEEAAALIGVQVAQTMAGRRLAVDARRS